MSSLKFYSAAVLLLMAMLVGSTVWAKSNVRLIDWLELMPEAERKALEELSMSIDHSGDGPSYDFSSVTTVAKMDGVTGRLAGYVVPIEYDDKGRISELFVVPYFGACIHLPPPPPNQIIHVKPDEPIEARDMWEPYWAIGTLRIANVSNEMAEAAYSMEVSELRVIEMDEYEELEESY